MVLKRLGASVGLCACSVLMAVSCQASTLFDFGPATGKSLDNASSSTTGTVLGTPFDLGLALVITATSGGGPGTLECVQGATVGDCASSAGVGGNLSYGLGVGNGRIDHNPLETIIFTVQPGYSVSLVSFEVSSANIGQPTYKIDGGAFQNGNTGSGNPVTTTLGSPAPFDTLTFGSSSGSYALAQITVDITSTSAPEPATAGLAGLVLIGLGIALRRKPRKA